MEWLIRLFTGKHYYFIVYTANKAGGTAQGNINVECKKIQNIGDVRNVEEYLMKFLGIDELIINSFCKYD